MSEQMQILYMQTRLVRLASEKWGVPMAEVTRLFADNKVFAYIANLWGLFHLEGDEMVLSDIDDYLKQKNVRV